jgi:hypothetical protein
VKEASVHAVVVQVSIGAGRGEEATNMLREEVVPGAREQPGFVSGTWIRHSSGERGMGIVLFESQEAAEATAQVIRSQPAEGLPVTRESVEVYEVLAQASS